MSLCSRVVFGVLVLFAATTFGVCVTYGGGGTNYEKKCPHNCENPAVIGAACITCDEQGRYYEALLPGATGYEAGQYWPMCGYLANGTCKMKSLGEKEDGTPFLVHWCFVDSVIVNEKGEKHQCIRNIPEPQTDPNPPGPGGS
jgi:hypothetical protein